MKNFNTNYSEIRLLANENIQFWNDNISFELVPVKVRDMFLEIELIWFINFLQEDLSEIQSSLKNYEIKTHFDFIQLICALGESTEETKKLSERFLFALQKIIPKIELKGKFLMIDKEVLTNSMFYEIVVVLFKVINQKEPIQIVETDDALTRKMKAAQRRAQEIKRKGKKINESTTKFEDMFAALLYEYPQYKLEDLFDLNLYTFYYLFKYIGKIANYEVSKIAAGNGLAKKHKYFIEK